MDKKGARQFLDLLGHRVDVMRLEKLEDPNRRLHWLYRASHPSIGQFDAPDERTAWKRLCDAADAQGPLPDVCQATTKSGQPCKNGPQRGERFCGSHLGQAPVRVDATPVAGLCQAKTKKGRPCQNAPQKGEQYCGPHLNKVRSS